MPEISRFYGIVITINFSDHAPPHFHASYAGDEASVVIEEPRILAGYLPPHARRMVVRWAMLHRGELLSHWRWAQGRHASERPAPIAPLE